MALAKDKTDPKYIAQVKAGLIIDPDALASIPALEAAERAAFEAKQAALRRAQSAARR